MAHGQELGATEDFVINSDYSVNLYVPPKTLMATHAGTIAGINYNSALDAIANGSANIVDHYDHGKSCPNFTLLKWTRSTAGAAKMKDWIYERGTESYDDIVGWLDLPSNSLASDIAVIRHRPKLQAMTLRQLIGELDSSNYSEYRCAFCRAPGLLAKKLIAHVGGSKKPGGGTY